MRQLARSLASAVFALSAALPGIAAPPPPVIGAIHGAIAMPPLAYIFELGGPYKGVVGQTFKVYTPGMATGVYLPFYCGSGRVLVQLRDVAGGLPGGNILTEGTLDSTAFPTWPTYPQLSFIYVEFKTPVYAGSGVDMSIVVTNKGGACWYSMSPAGADYPWGDGFYFYSGGWVPLNSPSYGPDWPFQLVVTP